ncbi:MAG TPA: hypothetical protein VF658_15315 [Pyrinomonadaceae bacterium]|jgi:hypothetical protein
MSERRDDTTEEDESSPVKNERQPGSYYYDDATGYEVYDPAQDAETEDETAKDEQQS